VVEVHLQVREAQLFVSGIQLAAGQVHDGEVAAGLHEHLLAVSRNAVTGGVAHLGLLLLLEVEDVQLALLEVEELVAHRGERPVGGGGRRQHGDALGEALGIDLHRDLRRLGGLGRTGVLALVRPLVRLPAGLAVGCPARGLVLPGL